MDMNSDGDRTGLAVGLIGLGVLFTPLGSLVGGFWPGILFVFAAAIIARDVAEGDRWNQSPGLFLVGLGVIFLLHFSFALLLILAGLVLLFGYSFRPKGFGWHHHDDGEFFNDHREHDEFV